MQLRRGPAAVTEENVLMPLSAGWEGGTFARFRSQKTCPLNRLLLSSWNGASDLWRFFTWMKYGILCAQAQRIFYWAL